MKYITTLSLILILLQEHPHASGNYIDYFPLSIGNKWFYHSQIYDSYSGRSSIDRIKVELTGTEILNGKTYYIFTRTILHLNGTQPFEPGLFLFSFDLNRLRIDPISGIIYMYTTSQYCSYPPFEYMTDSLAAKVNDSIRINCIQYPYYYMCISTIYQKSYYRYYQSGTPGPYVTLKRTYDSSAGFSYSDYRLSGGTGSYSSEQTLLGRVIEGIVFGDTAFTLTSIANLSGNIPVKFSLSQSYPNPFNPITKIKFDISGTSASQIVLSVYDLLGREVAVLVNEKLTPGEYEVDFDGSNLPSGVYYYRLTAGNYSETRKMVLVK